MTAVYRSYWLNAVLVEQPSGLFEIVGLDERTMVFTLPGDAVELLDPDGGRDAVLAEVAAALVDVKMSKATRAAVACALDWLGGEV